MILYTLGTASFPFDRAVDWLQELLDKEIIVEPVILQHGVTSAAMLGHPRLTCMTSLPRNKMHEVVKKTSLVISHAGQGSTRMLMEMGACFVLLPRLKRYGEHIDDHQLLFARAMEKFGVCHCTELHQLIHFIKQPPLPVQNKLLQAPLLTDYLAIRYEEVSAGFS